MRGPLNGLLKGMGIKVSDIRDELSVLTRDKKCLLEAGIQLGYLSKEDVLYICNPNTTDGDATRRLTYKRRVHV